MMKKQLKEIYLRVHSAEHARIVKERLVQMGAKKGFQYDFGDVFPKYIRVTKSNRVTWSTWCSRRIFLTDKSKRVTFEDLFDPSKQKDLFDETPEIELTLTVNGKEIHPNTLSRETWDNFYLTG